MKVGIKKTVEVDVKEFRLHIKVCDRFEGDLVDAQGYSVRSYEGYVPGFFPGEHYGDYLILNIDIETGQITNWKKPAESEIDEFARGEDED